MLWTVLNGVDGQIALREGLPIRAAFIATVAGPPGPVIEKWMLDRIVQTFDHQIIPPDPDVEMKCRVEVDNRRLRFSPVPGTGVYCRHLQTAHSLLAINPVRENPVVYTSTLNSRPWLR